MVPTSVAAEIQGRGPTDITVQALGNTAWIVCVEAPMIPQLIQAWDVGEVRIPHARPVLERLRQAGMYLSDRIMTQSLALVGE
jgi:hypothetical protein